MMDRLSGRVLSVEVDRDGSTLTADAFTGDTVLYMEDATDFSEDGGKLVLHDGTRVNYESADMDDDTVTLVDDLLIDIAEGTLIKTYPVVVTRWAVVEVFGYDDPLNVRVPHHYWPWLKLGARAEAKQELVTVIYDSQDWVIFDVDGVAKPKLNDEHASRERIYRYTSEGNGFAGYRGVKLKEEDTGNIYACRARTKGGASSGNEFDLLLNGTSIATMTIPSGSEYSPLVSLDEDFVPGDRLRVEYSDPTGADPDIVVWVYAKIDVD